MTRALVGAVVPDEVVVAVREVDVFFVEDGGPLERGAYSERQLKSASILGLVELHEKNTKGNWEICEGDITVQKLARGAVAVLGVERLFAAELVLDASAVAAAFVEGVEVGVGGVDAVGRALLPFLVLHFGFALCRVHFSGVWLASSGV